MQAYEHYLDRLKKWLWIEDEQGLDIIMGTAVAVMLPGDPIWTFVVDPPGALKTEICRSLTGSRIYSLDALTPESLISGLKIKGGKNIDILPDLDGKLLVIKDFTTILNKPEKVRNELFGRLRAAYDGYLEQAYGSGVKKKGFKAKFGILAAVTPMIDSYITIHALLGERFIRVKTGYNREKAVKSALNHSGNEDKMRAEIQKAAASFLIQCEHLVGQARTNPCDKEKIGALGDIVAILRTPVARNFKHEVMSMPEAEVGTRLSKQLLRLGQALEVFGRYSYGTLVRCGRDCIPSVRLSILGFLEYGDRKAVDIVDGVSFTDYIVRRELESLNLLKVLEQRENPKGTHWYKVEGGFLSKLQKAEL